MYRTLKPHYSSDILMILQNSNQLRDFYFAVPKRLVPGVREYTSSLIRNFVISGQFYNIH